MYNVHVAVESSSQPLHRGSLVLERCSGMRDCTVNTSGPAQCGAINRNSVRYVDPRAHRDPLPLATCLSNLCNNGVTFRALPSDRPCRGHYMLCFFKMILGVHPIIVDSREGKKENTIYRST